jgi:hypothetical protein
MLRDDGLITDPEPKPVVATAKTPDRITLLELRVRALELKLEERTNQTSKQANSKTSKQQNKQTAKQQRSKQATSKQQTEKGKNK